MNKSFSSLAGIPQIRRTRQDYEDQVQEGRRKWFVPYCSAFQLEKVKFEDIPEKSVFFDIRSDYLGDDENVAQLRQLIMAVFDEHFLHAPSPLELNT